MRVSLKRSLRHGVYLYPGYEIVKDEPQEDCSVGFIDVATGRTLTTWNVYPDGDDEPAVRKRTLREVREWLAQIA